MTERANIKVDRETFERHNQFRDMLGVTWAEYLERARRTEETDIEAVIRQVVRQEMEQYYPDGRTCGHCDRESTKLRPHPDNDSMLVCLGCHNRLLG